MTKAIFDDDFAAADHILMTVGLNGLRFMIAEAIATERQRCYEIAIGGNGRQIADAIMYRSPAGVRP